MIDLGFVASCPSSGGHMKIRRSLAVFACAPLLCAAVPLMPSLSHAAVAQSATMSITGTMVAMPQPTAPTSLFIQVGSQTILVSITHDTRVVRADFTAAGLADLRDNDVLKITGMLTGMSGITAGLVQDLSLYSSAPTATPSPSPTVTPAVSPTQVPAVSPTQVPAQFDVKGTLYALPGQLTPPTIICLAKAQVTSGINSNIAIVSPCASGLLPVYVTAGTKLTRNDGSASALFELRAGDSLEAHGAFVNTQFTAAGLDDHSLHETYTQFTGTVQGVSSDGALTLVTVTVNKRLSDHSPVPNNVSLVLPLTNSGSVYCAAPNAIQAPCTAVTINGVATSGYPGYGIGDGTVVTAQGLYNNTLNTFEYTMWISAGSTVQNPTATATATWTATATSTPIATVPPVTAPTLSLSGWLRSPASPNTPPTMLCVYKAQVTGGISPNIRITSPCPSGELPVYVTTSTVIVRGDGGVIPVSYMHSNNRLEIRGAFVNAQFTATWIRDASLSSLMQVSFKARIAFVSPFTSPMYLAVRTLRDSEQSNPFRTGTALSVFVQPDTIIYLPHYRTTHSITALNPGERILVWAEYDRDQHRVASTMHITVL
jgi:hypothetical protein